MVRVWVGVWVGLRVEVGNGVDSGVPATKIGGAGGDIAYYGVG